MSEPMTREEAISWLEHIDIRSSQFTPSYMIALRMAVVALRRIQEIHIESDKVECHGCDKETEYQCFQCKIYEMSKPPQEQPADGH